MHSFLEALEPRIAPAALLNATTVQYTDVDGDAVTVTVSKGAFSADSGNANYWKNYFDFADAGAGREVLTVMDFTDAHFAGTTVTIAAKKALTGDGFVNVGQLNADGNDLGAVKIGGGLVQIYAGNNVTPNAGVASLAVTSLGLDYGDFGLSSSESVIHGALGSLTVTGDVHGSLFVDGGALAGIGKGSIGGSLTAGADGKAWIQATGAIGSFTVGGSIDGRAATGDHGAGIVSSAALSGLTVGGSVYGGDFNHTGYIAGASVGKVAIAGGVIGKDGDYSGTISSGGALGGLTIGTRGVGNLQGGAGLSSGSIVAGGALGAVSIQGSVVGDDGNFSGSIYSTGDMAGVTVVGSLLGGDGEQTGRIAATGGNIGAVVIGGKIQGAGEFQSVVTNAPTTVGNVETVTQSLDVTGNYSGSIYAAKDIKSVSVGLDLIGGEGFDSGSIIANGLISSVIVKGKVQGAGTVHAIETTATNTSTGVVTVTEGTASTGDSSGLISAGKTLGTVSVGSLLGDDGKFSGSVYAATGITGVTVVGDVLGGTGESSGRISTGGAIGTVAIGGKLQGGGSFDIQEQTVTDGDTVTVTEGLFTTGNYSGAVYATKDIKSVSVGLDVLGADGIYSGSINSEGIIAAIIVKGKIQGAGSAHVLDKTVTVGTDDPVVTTLGTAVTGDWSGSVSGNKGLGTVTVGGSLLGGLGLDSGSVQGGGQFGSSPILTGNISAVTITGDVTGNDGVRSGSIIAWGNAGVGGVISGVTIGGAVTGGDGQFSALIYGANSIAKVTVGKGLSGGDGSYSGRIAAERFGSLGAVSVGVSKTLPGSVQGGAGENSGTIFAGVNLGPVIVGGSLVAGTGSESGSIQATNVAGDTQATTGSITSVNIGGNATGGEGWRSGSIYAAKSIGAVTIGGNLSGGVGVSSGCVQATNELTKSDNTTVAATAGAISSVSIGGNAAGGAGDYSGAIYAAKDIGTVKVTQDLVGSTGSSSGSIQSNSGKITAVTVGRDVLGGDAYRSGVVVGNTALGTVTIGRHLAGGDASQTGMVLSFGALTSLTVGGNVTGTDYSFTGYVVGQKGIGTVSIGGDLVGGDNTHGHTYGTGAVVSGYVDDTGNITFGAINSITVKGSIISGHKTDGTKQLQDSGAIRASGHIGKLAVGQSVTGNDTMPVWITGFVNVTNTFQSNIVLPSITITKDVSYAIIAAGVIDAGSDGFYGGAPFARIGTVTVGGNWTASSMTAGAHPGPNGYGVGDTMMTSLFTGTPAGLTSNIAKVVITGNVIGGGVGDQYGFVAQSFGALSVKGLAKAIPAAGGTTPLTVDSSVVIHRV